MNYKYKASLQRLFSIFPNGENINFFFQKYLTRSLPVSNKEFLLKIESVKMHFDNFILYGNNKNIGQCSYFEFGSGYDLVIPIGIRLAGFGKLVCIDIRELVFPELINDTIRRLRKLKGKPAFEYVFSEIIPEINKRNYKEVLKKYFNIDYIAPLDARKTHLENDSIDFILSNATMEHIPKKDLGGILNECHRILKPGGIMSNAIDYRDHWSFFDNKISVYNYLQFSEKKWKRYNPSIMYQNRMRHKEYLKVIEAVGFEVVKERIDCPDDKEFDKLKVLNLDEYFKNNFSLEELSIKSSEIVLRKI